MIKNNKYVLSFVFFSMLPIFSNQAAGHDFEGPPARAVDAVRPLKGTYVWGEGVETFTPCGQDRDYWVFPNTDEMWEQLKSEHQRLSVEPYGGIYVEVDGVLGPKLHPVVGGEYAADFDGHIVIENIIVMRRKSETDCKP